MEPRALTATTSSNGSRPPEPRPLPIEIEASPVYELLMSLVVFSRQEDAESFDVGTGWFESVRSTASHEMLAICQELDPPPWLWLHLLGVVYKMPGSKRPARFLEHLGEYDPELLSFHLLGAYATGRRVPPAWLRQAGEGDRGAKLRVAALVFADDAVSQLALARLLTLPPDRLKQLVIGLLERWYSEFFRHQEREVASVLASEARAKRVVGKTSPERLVRFVTRGIDYVAEPDVHRILLIPSIIVRPWVMMSRFGSTRVFCYPVEDDASTHPDAPPPRLVRIHRALAHEDRLRILRYLLRAPMTAQDLSRELARPPARVQAHLVMLRAAGLVNLRLAGSQVSSVHPNLVPTVYRTLRAYLPAATGRDQAKIDEEDNISI